MELPLGHLSARRSERFATDAIVMFRRTGRATYPVRVYDASPHGCRCEFIDRPEMDEHVWIRFNNMEPIEAEMCWVDGFKGGFNFINPIHPAVFERLIAPYVSLHNLP